MPGVITLTIKVITLTIKVITPFMPVSYLFHKLKSGQFPWHGASAPGVNRALQMRSLARSTVGEFEKERTRLGPKSDFFWREKLDVWRESV